MKDGSTGIHSWLQQDELHLPGAARVSLVHSNFCKGMGFPVKNHVTIAHIFSPWVGNPALALTLIALVASEEQRPCIDLCADLRL